MHEDHHATRLWHSSLLCKLGTSPTPAARAASYDVWPNAEIVKKYYILRIFPLSYEKEKHQFQQHGLPRGVGKCCNHEKILRTLPLTYEKEKYQSVVHLIRKSEGTKRWHVVTST